MTLHVWIPQRTAAEDRAHLAVLATLHEVPEGGALPQGAARTADLLVIDHDPGDGLAVIPHLDGLRYVQSLSAGVDRLVGRLPDGLTLCDAAGVHDIAVSEWVVMATLAARRGLADLVLAQEGHAWRGRGDMASWADLDGATVLILGHGSIGRAVEERLAPFGARFIRVARTARDGVEPVARLAEVLPRADVVVVLLPLTDATRGFVDAAFLRLMQPGALLVNASRGKVVDTGALLAALHDGHVRAALDVTDPEPLPADHPLWAAPGLLITPHIASSVRQEESRAWSLVTDQVRRLAAGEPLRNVVRDGY